MCLVEVEKAPKPLPACATPVMEGMKVFTKSARAIGAQRATMEFLLINHPLDCPICDQGGEWELEDLAVGFGRDLSRYHAGKRAVADEHAGPPMRADSTRSTRCCAARPPGSRPTGRARSRRSRRGCAPAPPTSVSWRAARARSRSCTSRGASRGD